MKNLFRAIRLTFRYKFSIIASIFCALMIGALWGGNIGAITWPICEICLKDDNFVDWTRRKLAATETAHVELQSKVADLEATLKRELENADAPTQKKLRHQLKSENDALVVSERTLWILKKIQPAIEKYCPQDAFATVIIIVIFATCMSLLKGLFTISHSLLSARIALGTIYELRNQMFQKIIRYEVNYFSQEGTSNAMGRLIGDITSLSSGLTIFYGKLIREPIKMFACLIGAAWISWQLLIATLVLVPIAGYSIRWLAKSLKRAVRRGMEQGILLFARMEESLRSIRIVKAFVTERKEYEKFQQTNKKLYEMGMKAAKYDALTNPMTEFLGICMISIGVACGSYLVMGHRTDIFGIPMSTTPLSQPMLLAFFALLAGAADPARKLSDIFTHCQTAIVAADRVYEMIDRESPIKEIPNAVALPRHTKSIAFENITFGYNPQKTILKDISLNIPFGETIGIVGPSGCGKSTLLSLIPRFMDPTLGEILIDGIPIQTAKLGELRKMMGIITQEPILFNETVRENIRYGSPDASDEDVIEAAKQGSAHEFIVNELKDGYDTVVGPGGAQLSGGQRQRIALARTFLCDPAILLLDEATSQIDLYSEQMIHEALAKFVGKRTTIIVTHRLSALALTDRIVVLKDGVIESIGTQKELMDSSPYFQRLQGIN